MGVLDRVDFSLIEELIKKYTVYYINQDFLKIDASSEIDIEEIRVGLSIANIMASMEEGKYKEKALKYASIVANISTEQDILWRCEKIFDSLSFFTFGEVLKKKRDYKKDLVHPKGITAFRGLYQEEVYTREFANKKVKLNSFQLDINDKFDEVQNFSVSAPTSIGKSFLMRKVVIDTVLENSCGKVVYLVPTRALINEIISDFQTELSGLEVDEEIFITCSSEINDEMLTQKGIFILTQERVNQLCCNCVGTGLEIRLLVVDEAQQIGDGSRGLLLEYTIKRMKELWKGLRIFFVSPLINNPEIYIDKFELGDSHCKYETISSVNQNLITLNKVHRESRIDINYQNETIGSIPYVEKKLGRVEKKVAYIISKFNNGENSLIYCNKPNYTRKICNELMECVRFEESKDEEVLEFCEFLKSYICKEYELAKLIRFGVAYHYSKLPTIIKNGIEELAKKGKLKIVACTSTLLEGVNIQANNIYIFNAKKNNTQLSNLEFWNLAGRAGRMNRDICGNIICIDISKADYSEKYIDKNIEKLTFKKDKMIDGDLSDFNKYIYDKKSIKVTKHNRDIIESNQNLESILILEKLEGKDLREIYDNVGIRLVDRILEQKIERNKVSEELLKRLVGIDIDAINTLWHIFTRDYAFIERYFLINPFQDNSDERFEFILNGINKIFFYNRYTNESLDYIKGISLKWMREKSLRDLIFGQANLNEYTAKEINNLIEERLEMLNNDIRFNMSKYLYAYQEILKEVLITNGGEKYIEKMCNYPLYLEFGASSKKTLELMYLGIFREGAIILSKYISTDEPLSIMRQLKKIDIDSISANNYIKKKLKEKISML